MELLEPLGVEHCWVWASLEFPERHLSPLEAAGRCP